jgi:hypothetical protein
MTEIVVCQRQSGNKAPLVPSIGGFCYDCGRAIWIRAAGPIARAHICVQCIDAAEFADAAEGLDDNEAVAS